MYIVPEERYQILNKYYLEHGELRPSNGEMYCGIDLYSYLIELKKKYNKQSIDPECIKKLEKIGMIWDLNEYKWEKNYKEVLKYYKEFGHINIPIRYETVDGIKIGKWLQLQRIQHEKCNSCSADISAIEHFEKLQKLGIIWDPLEEQWLKYYCLAKKYYEDKGDLLIPNNYIDEQGTNLGSWIANQKKYYRINNTPQRNPKFTEERIEMLEQIGMIWNPHCYIKRRTEEKQRKISENQKKIKKEKMNITWNKYYIAAQKYLAQKGNLLIPSDYKVDGIGLGAWIGVQRRKYKAGQLQQEKIDKLEKIYMIWDYEGYIWNEYYAFAKSFYEENGHLSIPFDYQICNMNLGSWLNNQRAKYKKNRLDQDKIDKLNDIKIKWFVFDEEWQEKFLIYKKYVMLGKDTNISPQKRYDGINLYNWIGMQRKNKKNGRLSEDKIKQLEDVGFLWDPLEDLWFNYYDYAKIYYEKYGDLLIPVSYIIDDIRLGQWVASQRSYYKKRGKNNANSNFTEERIILLEKIGMSWFLPANYNKTSFEEQCVFFYVKRYFADAINNYNDLGTELDIFIPSLQVAIEYDGEYWHERKRKKDSEKNHFCMLNKIQLIRIREPKCKTLEGQYKEYKLEDNSNICLEKKLKQIFEEEFNIDLDVDIIRDMDAIMDRYYVRVNEDWNEKFNYAKRYFEERGNLLVPFDFVIDGINLGAWIGTQRQAYKGRGKSRITKKHIELLDSIGMVWDVKQAIWESKYLLAQKYYIENGNLRIPINYTMAGVKIGRWISTQRQAYKGNHYKITTKQIEKLEAIGMLW